MPKRRVRQRKKRESKVHSRSEFSDGNKIMSLLYIWKKENVNYLIYICIQFSLNLILLAINALKSIKFYEI